MKMTLTIEVDGEDGVSVEPVEGGLLIRTQRGVEQPVDEFDDEDEAARSILERWRGENPTSNAFALLEEWRNEGAEVRTPVTRKEGKQVEPYFRRIDRTASGRKVSMYLNTSTVTFNGAFAVDKLAETPGAVVRTSGSAVAFSLENLTLYRAALKLLLSS